MPGRKAAVVDLSTDLRDVVRGFALAAEAPACFVKLATVPNYDLPNPDSAAGKVIGWAKLSDFDFQELRNCN
ncbi:hypothetical protein IST453_05338 [Burkholderia multivorans]|uniref:hypothetical protein n=1 Tax=Burkholderia multivorans TaxID=87883 RepID=UPI0019A59540|nr:hypothetical protein [Burkholderia multivorans]CAB5314372.1 hypothetical protein IST453_05338 [Burkholderia multivorans]